MRILVVGGGSGGHVTPILPVVDELKARNAEAHITFVGQRGDAASLRMRDIHTIDGVHFILAGKWRRYYGQSFMDRLFDFRTNILNLRDALFFGVGFLQSLIYLGLRRPNAVFIKGGYVGVPVGLAAGVLKIPYITHDSDTLSGLANRIIAPHAALNAVGAPPENYTYAKEKMRYTGVPIRALHPVGAQEKNKIKKRLGFSNEPLVLVTGGGNGAESINNATAFIAQELMHEANVVHVTGEDKSSDVESLIGDVIDTSRYRILGYTDDFISYVLAADVVVTRAGATTVAELASAHKAAIIVPAPQLSDQVKNAKMLLEEGLFLLDDNVLAHNPITLLSGIMEIIGDSRVQEKYEEAIAKLSKPDAASAIADLVLDIAGNNSNA